MLALGVIRAGADPVDLRPSDAELEVLNFASVMMFVSRSGRMRGRIRTSMCIMMLSICPLASVTPENGLKR